MGRQCPEILIAVKFLFSSGGRFESKYFSNWYVFFLNFVIYLSFTSCLHTGTIGYYWIENKLLNLFLISLEYLFISFG